MRPPWAIKLLSPYPRYKKVARRVVVECFGASRPQQGRRADEDAFLIRHGQLPLAAVCDGAGHAQKVAKRVLIFFEKLFKEASPRQVSKDRTWAGWIELLDSFMLGGAESTFVSVAVVNSIAVGACVGDSRAYFVNRDGDCQLITVGASKFRLGSGRAEAFAIRQPLASGEVLLLLSDVARMSLGPCPLKTAVTSALARDFPDVPEAILQAAGRSGRADDMTAVALRVLSRPYWPPSFFLSFLSPLFTGPPTALRRYNRPNAQERTFCAARVPLPQPKWPRD